MKKLSIIIAYLLFIHSLSVGQIKLAGEQDGVFDSSTYIVSNDLIVPLGKKLEFLPKAKLLFLPFTGIKVDGQLKMIDARLASYDSTGNWNGIEVGLNGRIHLENVTIHRSVMGVGVPDSSAIQCFSNITFAGNKSTLRIADSPVFIREGKSFTYGERNLNVQKEESLHLSSGRLLNTDYKKKSPIKAVMRISAITSLVCIAGCIACEVESKHKYSEYEKSLDKEHAKRYKEQSIAYRNIAIGTGICAGVTGVTFSTCFAFGSKKD